MSHLLYTRTYCAGVLLDRGLFFLYAKPCFVRECSVSNQEGISMLRRFFSAVSVSDLKRSTSTSQRKAEIVPAVLQEGYVLPRSSGEHPYQVPPGVVPLRLLPARLCGRNEMNNH